MHLYPNTGRIALIIFAALSLPFILHGKSSAQGKQTTGVRCLVVNGALLLQSAPSKWTPVSANSEVPTDQRLVALFGANFLSPNEAVLARLLADVGQRGPFPVLEAAVRFHASKDVDLEVTLERGILGLTNKKQSGPAHVRLHVAGQQFDVTLSDSTTRLGVEVYGRHVRGTANLADPKKDVPVINVVFLTVAGEALISDGKQATRLQAPPGTAMYLWDNITRQHELTRFDQLPDFAKPMDEKELKKYADICECGKHLAMKPNEIGKTLEQATHANEARERKVAVVALGALDELPRLVSVFDNKDHADTRDMAVLVLRHWLGREPGQSVKLYEYLTKTLSYSRVQAKGMLYLCEGLDEAKKKKPATYDVLIQALNSSKAPLRVLAHWHLVRLAPDGKAIAYDPTSPEAQRLQAIAEWRRLVPEGELPSPSKKKS